MSFAIARLRSAPLPGLRVVGLALRQHRPQLPGVLVGDGDQGLVIADPSVEHDDPLLQTGEDPLQLA
jgi:hypothetical protein